ncbi:Na+/H+ antiporter NhaC family protein [Aestuariibacter halophilus]|uniref:Na+/H+ antiporter NhaC family protein n=1 Tax=Fluctibacter halophilus TaxID=226011 RepID=A0ABS8GBL2_9ALTE|nr:Na+/H+ antiporter NhaC family protein [Aestuariibacter halophilus]MCC2616606.1 Na+/H+ antiporter NhaC family protein [Aestuariibacter halophilus]
MLSLTPLSARKAISLLPILLFLLLFLGSGLYFEAQGVEYGFYQLPAPIAVIPAIALSLWLARGPLQRRLDTLINGMGHTNIITMCLIYLMAGAFSELARQTGGVDAAVQFGLSVLPDWAMLSGLFLLSALLATAMGTSMGTLAALAPIGLGIVQTTEMSAPLMAGILLSGAMFGDNLSVISDTTIAATRTQGANMAEKWRTNLRLALPAACIVLLVLSALEQPAKPPLADATNGLLALPYVLVLVLAVCRVNVFVVLASGWLACVILGVWVGDYALDQVVSDTYQGITGMQDIFLLSLLLGGLFALVASQGGVTWLVERLSSIVQRLPLGKSRASTLVIGGLSALANVCVANNTVAILVSGDAARDIAQQGGVSRAKSASMLDIFACCVQGLLPYGAQVLLLGAALSISPLSIIPFVTYCQVLALIVVLHVLLSGVVRLPIALRARAGEQ